MAKVIEYNVEGVEESGGGTGVARKPGLVVGKIMLCEHYEKAKDGSPANSIRLGIAVGDEYDWVWTYVGLDPSSDWKLAEFIRAVKEKDKGKLNLEKQKNKLVRVKLNPGEYLGAYRPEVGKILPPQPGDTYGSSAATLAPDAADTTTDDTTDEPTTDTKTYSNPDFVPSREGDEGIGSYDDWADADLEAEVGDRDLTIPGGRGSKRDKMIKALRDEDAEVAGGEEEAETPADEATAPENGDDYEDWGLDKLKEEWTAREMGDLPQIRGRNAEARLKAQIIEEIRKDDAENPFS